ncbi:MAG: hypothetical protein ABFD50_08235 [Smithella sp.]
MVKDANISLKPHLIDYRYILTHLLDKVNNKKDATMKILLCIVSIAPVQNCPRYRFDWRGFSVRGTQFKQYKPKHPKTSTLIVVF